MQEMVETIAIEDMKMKSTFDNFENSWSNRRTNGFIRVVSVKIFSRLQHIHLKSTEKWFFF